ncbi:MAG: acetylxylan esterase, partial [Planctomycetota bacterium]
ADPRGEFLACKHADPVYRLLGADGLGSDRMPELDSPIQQGMIGYHVRSGGHNLAEYDWQQYMNFADARFVTRDSR